MTQRSVPLGHWVAPEVPVGGGLLASDDHSQPHIPDAVLPNFLAGFFSLSRCSISQPMQEALAKVLGQPQSPAVKVMHC